LKTIRKMMHIGSKGGANKRKLKKKDENGKSCFKCQFGGV
jgi:hypothetical protein